MAQSPLIPFRVTRPSASYYQRRESHHLVKYQHHSWHHLSFSKMPSLQVLAGSDHRAWGFWRPHNLQHGSVERDTLLHISNIIRILPEGHPITQRYYDSCSSMGLCLQDVKKQNKLCSCASPTPFYLWELNLVSRETTFFCQAGEKWKEKAKCYWQISAEQTLWNIEIRKSTGFFLQMYLVIAYATD